uniref:Dynactin subunit 5 n=1 Tax=Euplotes crassus TaxID=5936 RepID=A0A7S3P0G5_EUPCR|mmetsp:Transcript_389/g.352  ORF Transcript_389/g.352 Transcript_389/m.352 type:complete len:130 (+) Transcript_389:331-720(+)
MSILENKCHIGERSIIKDNVYIEEGSVIEPDMIIPSFTAYGGRPATFKGLLVESFPMIMKQKCSTYFKKFKPFIKKKSSTSGSKSERGSRLLSARSNASSSKDSPSKASMTSREQTSSGMLGTEEDSKE